MRVTNAICKYSYGTIWRKRCSDYGTNKCADCIHNEYLQQDLKMKEKNGDKSYYKPYGRCQRELF